MEKPNRKDQDEVEVDDIGGGSSGTMEGDSKMDQHQLLEAVRKQVEYYFSKENLQNDAYLTSQMDANMTVPLQVVLKFAKMKALTEDESVLRKALETSNLTVIDDRIKANIKAVGRSTIILREIPSDVTEAEVKEIFNFDGCKTISSMRSDIGDTWFVMMDSEEDAKDTLIDLKLKKRMFRGQPVKGRLKSETVVRSFYPVQAAPAAMPSAGTYPGISSSSTLFLSLSYPILLYPTHTLPHILTNPCQYTPPTGMPPMQYPPAGGFVPAGLAPVDLRFAGYGMGGPMGGAPLVPGGNAPLLGTPPRPHPHPFPLHLTPFFHIIPSSLLPLRPRSQR